MVASIVSMRRLAALDRHVTSFAFVQPRFTALGHLINRAIRHKGAKVPAVPALKREITTT